MKKICKNICAVSLAAVMMLSGCSSRPAKITEFKLTSSTEAGNSGDVKLEKGDTYAVISVKDYGDIKVKLYPKEMPYSVYNFVELAKSGAYNGRNFHRIVKDFMIQGGSANGAGGAGQCIDGGNFKNEVNTSLRHYYGALCYAESSMGDISDGFYIVNKKSTNAIADYYNSNYSVCVKKAKSYKAQLEALDPAAENYDKIMKNGTALFNYMIGSAKAIEAMYNTITDEVTKTYNERGGVPQLDGMYTVFGQTVEGFDVIDRISAVETVETGSGEVSKPTSDIIIEKVEIFTVE